jgi:hypothetical protein
MADLIAGLRADGALDDTLVLITSDESSGLHGGLDDLSLQLTQNWGFLIALVPGAEQRTSREPFLQSELALSVLDYLGLAGREHAFIGRSVFRTYSQKRPIIFANVLYSHVVGLDADGSLYVCPESFEGGEKYALEGDGLFGGRRALAAWREGEADFVRAMALRSLGTTPAAGKTYRLVAAPQIELAADGEKQLIFGGQYVSVPSTQVAEVTLDLAVTGDPEADVELSHHLAVCTQSLAVSRERIRLAAGARYRLTYGYRSKTDDAVLESGLFATQILPGVARLVIHEAQMRTVPADEWSGGRLHPGEVRVVAEETGAVRR